MFESTVLVSIIGAILGFFSAAFLVFLKFLLKRMQTVIDEIHAEAKRTNGRLGDLEKDGIFRAGERHEREREQLIEGRSVPKKK